MSTPLPHSFELFPPRTAEARRALPSVVDELIETGPEFMSVTYGAGGSSQDSSLAVLAQLLRAGVSPMAHLTCVGMTVETMSRLIRQFLDAGVSRFLALRGDLPEGTTDEAGALGDLKSGGELVQLIHRVQQQKEPYAETPLPGLPFASAVEPDRRPRVEVAVAAFPNGHPRSGPERSDIDALLAKEVGGATLAITQLFFHAHDYARFVELARARGVTIPILPGLFVPTTVRRLTRTAELAGEDAPAWLVERIASADPADAFRIGVDFTTQLIDDLLALGFGSELPGIHLYTFNRHRAAIEVLRAHGLAGGLAPGGGVQSPSPASPARSS